MAALCIWATAMPEPTAFAQTAAPTLRIIDTKQIADKSLGFTEPSGLILSADDLQYWAVSDDTGMVFLLDPDGLLVPEKSFDINVQGLEGITLDQAERRILAVRENTSEVIQVHPGDGKVSRHPLSQMEGFDRIAPSFGPLRTNDGIEGIAYNSDRGEVLLAKQVDPRLLLRLSSDLATVTDAVELTADLGYTCDGADDATLDVSDILYDSQRKVLWVLSDTGSCVLIADPASGRVIGQVPITNASDHEKQLRHTEGFALNASGTELRIVTDNGKNSHMITLSIE